MLSRRILSKEDESATIDAEVTREDQSRINAFSRLHNKEKRLEEELAAKKKDKEDIDEMATEIELLGGVDEDDDEEEGEQELIPYKIGDCFISLPPTEVLSLLTSSSERLESEVTTIEDTLEKIKQEMQELKVKLYARFGRGINLET